MADRKRALVIGGGPGGLAAAVALGRVGVEAHVFEQASELREIGAGVGLQPNAMKALRSMGLADRLLEGRPVLEWMDFHAAQGAVLARLPVGLASRSYGMPGLFALRSDIQSALLGALDRTLVHTGSRCVGVEEDAHGVLAHFADGRSAAGTVLVGADGIHSLVRQEVVGDGEPSYRGAVAWRSVVVPDRELFPSDAMKLFLGTGAQFIMANVGDNRVAWSAVALAPEADEAGAQGRKDEVLERFRSFGEPVQALLAQTPEAEILRNGTYDRDPVRRWSSERTTLLGDAAHPTSPFIGQGLGMALEDAVALAQELAMTAGLSDESLIAHAFSGYEQRRLERTTRVVLRSRRSARFLLSPQPALCRVREKIIGVLPEASWGWLLRRSYGPAM